jgi:CubicO group peptidase (beta-lactamase class C family)
VADVQGTCDERFAGVRAAFERLFDTGRDVGASVAVTVDGSMVVDLWGGHQDAAATLPWAEDTIINVFSTTKTMSFLAVLLLVDRGEVDLHAPVSRYWPEFAAAGKEDVEVRHLMAHTAGVSGWDQPMAPEDLYDWEKATSLLAGQTPWWTPGTKSGYHALTQGYLLGEVVRRVSGDTIGTLFAREIAGPLGADFHIGLSADQDRRVALVIPPPQPILPAVTGTAAPTATSTATDATTDGVGSAASDRASGGLGGAPDRTSVAYRTFVNPPLSAEQSWTLPWRRAEIPAAGGHGNARSVATAQTVLSCGGEVGGVRLLSAETCEQIFDVQAVGRDLVMGVGVTFGMGYGLNSPKAPIGPNPRTAYWGGWGGSLVVNDLDARMTVAYVMNRMGEGTVGDDRAHSLLAAAYESLSPRSPA